MRVGILALQGAFAEHAAMLAGLDAEAVPVRLPAHLEGLDGLILPGGESTSMRRLAGLTGLDSAMRAFGAERPVWGVCAGLILLAACIRDEDPCLGLLDITVERNAYGHQQESFVADLYVSGLEKPGMPLQGVFIRAPRVTRCGGGVQVLAQVQGQPVALRQGHILGSAFHPELTTDNRMHRYFLNMCVAGSAPKETSRDRGHDEVASG
ncbi:MAG: pyridoxal 5'-phosphate synthase glutaminase subunit PdxT [Desulfovibrionales bacterium]|nr:pyridoxal 5'-phosphate synthase glutaminase subunit PdxT [Desulfovibrionales bacterium]